MKGRRQVKKKSGLSQALKKGQLEKFIKQREAEGVGPRDGA